MRELSYKLPRCYPSWVKSCYANGSLDLSRFLPLWALYAIEIHRGITVRHIAERLGVSEGRVRQMYVLIVATDRTPEKREEYLLRLDAAITAITDERTGRQMTDGSLRSLLKMLQPTEHIDVVPGEPQEVRPELRPYCPMKGCTRRVLRNREKVYTTCYKHKQEKVVQP